MTVEGLTVGGVGVRLPVRMNVSQMTDFRRDGKGKEGTLRCWKRKTIHSG